MRVLTIDRSKWRCGGTLHRSSCAANNPRRGLGTIRMLNNMGFMCCLGFDALQYGLKAETIAEALDPEMVSFGESKSDSERNYIDTHLIIFDTGAVRNNDIVGQAISVNDDEGLSDSEREAALVPILKGLGWDDVVFVGEYVKGDSNGGTV